MLGISFSSFGDWKWKRRKTKQREINKISALEVKEQQFITGWKVLCARSSPTQLVVNVMRLSKSLQTNAAW